MNGAVRRVRVKVGGGYEVLIGGGLLGRCGELIARLRAPCAAALVTDGNVEGLYAERVSVSLRGRGFRVARFAFAPGEASKDLLTYGRALEFLAAQGFSRSDLVIALGGGVPGDLGGFAAATYLRGVGLVQMPTTLLAAVDSSVGGKTAVNLRAGKNLAGAFHQPAIVIMDTDTLGSLPGAALRDGMAEVIKYGMIADRALLEEAAGDGGPGDIGGVIERCVSIKARCVEEDERDDAGRQKLNFGHTVGHAAEKLSGFSLSHGQAVAAGMAVVTRAAHRRGWCPRECPDLLLAALRRHGLPESLPFSAGDLAEAALSDKKRRGGAITLALPLRAGECALRELPIEGLRALIADGMED